MFDMPLNALEAVQPDICPPASRNGAPDLSQQGSSTGINTLPQDQQLDYEVIHGTIPNLPEKMKKSQFESFNSQLTFDMTAHQNMFAQQQNKELYAHHRLKNPQLFHTQQIGGRKYVQQLAGKSNTATKDLAILTPEKLQSEAYPHPQVLSVRPQIMQAVE